MCKSIDTHASINTHIQLGMAHRMVHQVVQSFHKFPVPSSLSQVPCPQFAAPSSLPPSSLPQFPVPSSLSPSVAFGSSFFGSSSSKVMSRWFKGFSQRGLEDAIFFWASQIYPLIMCMFTSLSKWFTNSWSCRALRLEDFTPGEGTRYKHNNAQNETNNPYIVVRAYEGQFATSEHPAVPPTPNLAKAYEQGILEALVRWSPLHHPTNAAFDWRCQHGIMWMKGLPKQRETKEGEADDDTYLVPVGQGCFSFQRGLLHRAAQTYSKRSVGNKYELISRWLLTGLAIQTSRKNWNILSRNRTCTVTDFNLFRNYFLQGYPSEEKDKKKKPYALPHTHSLHASTFETAVARISYKRYLQKTTDFETARVQPGYYATINQANPIHATPEMEQIEPRDSVTEQGTEVRTEPAHASHHRALSETKGI